MPVPIPPPAEQAEILSRVERLLQAAHAVEERLNEAHEQIERCSRALLRKAFRGDLA
jgi:hypothetical protein